MAFKHLDLINSFLRGTNTTEVNEYFRGDIDESGYLDYKIGEETLKKYSIFRNLSTYLTVSKTDGKIIVPTSTDIAGVMQEGDSFPVSEEDFDELDFSSYKLGSIIKVKQDFVSDNDFNLINYLDNELGKRFGKAEERLILNGTGNDEPLGLLNLELDGVQTSSVTYDSITNLYFSLANDYRNDAVFIVSDEIAVNLRKLKDEDGNYLWNQNNDTIFGKKVYISNYMTDSTKPILFGNFAYLWIIHRKRLALKVLQELYVNNYQIGYAAKERLDFKLTEPNAVKVLSIQEVETSQE